MRKQTVLCTGLAVALLSVGGCSALQSIADTNPVHVIIDEKHQRAEGNYYSEWSTTDAASGSVSGASPGDTLTCVFDIDNQTNEQLLVRLATSSRLVEQKSDRTRRVLAERPSIEMKQPLLLNPGEMEKAYTFEVPVPTPNPDESYDPNRTAADCNLSVTARPASES